MIDRNGFRLNVGIILVNEERKVFWGKRIGPKNGWQFPQGGVNPYETLEETMYRELTEETGLKEEDVTILGKTKRWSYYYLPRRLRRPHQNPVCVGQKQKWFLLQLISDESRICLDCTATPEFSGWKWLDYWTPLKEVIYFKYDVYKKALRELECYLPKVKTETEC